MLRVEGNHAMKLTILLALVATAVCAAQIEPWFSMLVRIVPTPDPCGFTGGVGRCVKHKIVCPVW